MAGNQRQKQAKDIERSQKDLGNLLKYAREIHIRPITEQNTFCRMQAKLLIYEET